MADGQHPETAVSPLSCEECRIVPGALKQTVCANSDSKLCRVLESVQLEKNQRITTRTGGHVSLFIVAGGVVMLQTTLPDGRRQVLGFRFRGDIICSAFDRNLPGTVARAVNETVLLELPEEKLAEMAVKRPELVNALIALSTLQMERASVHNLVLGRLNATERLASFFLEVLLRSGRALNDRVEFSLPMSRDDIADYLGLNSETVSRAISSLRKAKAVKMPSPTTAYVEDLDRLASQTPLAAAIISRSHDNIIDEGWAWRITGASATKSPQNACPFSAREQS